MPDWQQQVAENALRYQRLAEHLSQLSITEASGDGAVRVTVSASGVLTDLVLRERWHPDPLPAIAAEIMDCLRRAQARIPDLLRQAMLDIVGDADPSAHLLLDEATRRFPQPSPREPATPRPRPRDEGEDWDERAFLEDV